MPLPGRGPVQALSRAADRLGTLAIHTGEDLGDAIGERLAVRLTAADFDSPATLDLLRERQPVYVEMRRRPGTWSAGARPASCSRARSSRCARARPRQPGGSGAAVAQGSARVSPVRRPRGAGHRRPLLARVATGGARLGRPASLAREPVVPGERGNRRGRAPAEESLPAAPMRWCSISCRRSRGAARSGRTKAAATPSARRWTPTGAPTVSSTSWQAGATSCSKRSAPWVFARSVACAARSVASSSTRNRVQGLPATVHGQRTPVELRPAEGCGGERGRHALDAHAALCDARAGEARQAGAGARAPRRRVGGRLRPDGLHPRAQDAWQRDPSRWLANPADFDLGLLLNRRKDERPALRIPVPFYGAGMSFGSIGVNVMLGARGRPGSLEPSCPPGRGATRSSSPRSPTTSSPRSPPGCSVYARRACSAPGCSESSTLRGPSPAWAGTCSATRTRPPWQPSARPCRVPRCSARFRSTPSTPSRITRSTSTGSSR